MKIILTMLLISNVVLADIKSAKKNYENKEFNKAFNEFTLLSKFGYSTIHHYLAIMYMNGEGVEKDLLQAYVWSRFSERDGNSYNDLTQLIKNELNETDIKKGEDLAKTYKKIYSYDFIKYKILESNSEVPLFEITSQKSKSTKPKYPRAMAINKQEGYVAFSFYIYPDGSVRDIYIESEFPIGAFTKEALNVVSKNSFNYKLNGENDKLVSPVIGEQLVEFKLDRTNLPIVPKEQEKFIEETRQRALEGDVWAGLKYYYFYTYYPNKNEPITPEQMNQWLINASNKGYSEALHILGRNMYYGIGILKQKQLGVDRLVKGALYGNHKAQYLLYKLISRKEIESKFANDDFYWLDNASKNGSLEAKLEFVQHISKLKNRDEKLIKRAKNYLKQYASEMIKTPDWYHAKSLLEAQNKQYSQAYVSINQAIKYARKANWDLTELKAQRKLIKKHAPIY